MTLADDVVAGGVLKMLMSDDDARTKDGHQNMFE